MNNESVRIQKISTKREKKQTDSCNKREILDYQSKDKGADFDQSILK